MRRVVSKHNPGFIFGKYFELLLNKKAQVAFLKHQGLNILELQNNSKVLK